MMEKVKQIVIAAEIFPPEIGGPATYSEKIATELSEFSWRVKLICYSQSQESNNYPFSVTRVVRQRNPFLHYASYLWQLLKLARGGDLIYAQGPVSSGLPAVIVGILLGKKVAVKVVGDYAWEQARNRNITEIGIDEFQRRKAAGKIGVLKKIEKFVCRSAALVIVPSFYLKRIVSGWGVRENKIAVIYNAFESLFVPSAKIPDPNLIISVGRLVPWKGFKCLIEIMPELLKTNGNFKLQIYGSGPMEERLERMIKDLELKDHVAILSVSRSQLINDLCGAGIFVLNTGYEGLPHSILEAMAAEVPIITTNVGGNPEVIKNGENGLLVENDNKEQLVDSILKLYSNELLRKKIVANAKITLAKFNTEKMISETIKVLESL
ncbi:glycosyltransferase family 4 protein [Candidatus Falkowbacteria bacterium]|nr:glycosyltransferase family 4 protein [Candidatus Falkowbacteria bacterium]